jgi:hypothetical protein
MKRSSRSWDENNNNKKRRNKNDLMELETEVEDGKFERLQELPDEMIYEICKKMDNKTLTKFVRSFTFAQKCADILPQRRKGVLVDYTYTLLSSFLNLEGLNERSSGVKTVDYLASCPKNPEARVAIHHGDTVYLFTTEKQRGLKSVLEKVFHSPENLEGGIGMAYRSPSNKDPDCVMNIEHVKNAISKWSGGQEWLKNIVVGQLIQVGKQRSWLRREPLTFSLKSWGGLFGFGIGTQSDSGKRTLTKYDGFSKEVNKLLKSTEETINQYVQENK